MFLSWFQCCRSQLPCWGHFCATDDMKQSCLEMIKMKAAVCRAQKAQAAKAHLWESLEQVKWCDTPEHLREPSTADQLHELIENEHIYSPLYYCLSCKGTVHCQPIEVYIFKELIEAVHSVAGLPDDLMVEDPHINDSDIWADMFYMK
ncbi:hypothetical protein BKA82DRAFT_4011368 [Pisolithus tinctorius]|nr:hypothetical protein BKA82DRAFT_4011368 [Pisolithus tinctorius]